MQRAHREVNVGATASVMFRNQDHVESGRVTPRILNMDGEDFPSVFLFQVKSGDDSLTTARNDQSRRGRCFEHFGMLQHAVGFRNHAERQAIPRERHARVDKFVRC